jgi:hypothetical protein
MMTAGPRSSPSATTTGRCTEEKEKKGKQAEFSRMRLDPSSKDSRGREAFVELYEGSGGSSSSIAKGGLLSSLVFAFCLFVHFFSKCHIPQVDRTVGFFFFFFFPLRLVPTQHRV